MSLLNTFKQDIRGQGNKMAHFAINFIAQLIFHKHMNIIKYQQKAMFYIFRKNHFKIAGDKRNKLSTRDIFNLQNSHLE